MTCSEARDQLRVADLDDLEPTQPGPLAAHISECESCRAAAARVVSETMLLRRGVQHRRMSSRRNRVMLLAAIPAAAAVIAIFVQARASSRRNAVEHNAQTQTTSGVGVDVSRGQHATVIKTADPKVTIIWLTPGVGE
jgi:hypothetical protein